MGPNRVQCIYLCCDPALLRARRRARFNARAATARVHAASEQIMAKHRLTVFKLSDDSVLGRTDARARSWIDSNDQNLAKAWAPLRPDQVGQHKPNDLKHGSIFVSIAAYHLCVCECCTNPSCARSQAVPVALPGLAVKHLLPMCEHQAVAVSTHR